MPFSDFQSYWLITSHDQDAPTEWQACLPVGCRFTFAEVADGGQIYVPGPGTRGPCAKLAPATSSGNTVTVAFASPVGAIEFGISRPRGNRRRETITLARPGHMHDLAHVGTRGVDHGGAHGIDD